MNTLKMEFLRVFHFTTLNGFSGIFEHGPHTVFQIVFFLLEWPVLIIIVEAILIKINLFIGEKSANARVFWEATIVTGTDRGPENQIQNIYVKHDQKRPSRSRVERLGWIPVFNPDVLWMEWVTFALLWLQVVVLNKLKIREKPVTES